MADSIRSERIKARDANRNALGLCLRCGRVPSIPGTKRCPECKEKDNLTARSRYESRLNKNICARCPNVVNNRKNLCDPCAAEQNSYQVSRSIKYKELAFSMYGNACACCGETLLMLLNIDHTKNNGAQHRRELGIRGGKEFYNWLRKNGFPADFQILCYSCNQGKYLNDGVCPHEDSRPYFTQGVAFDQPSSSNFFLTNESET